MSTAYVAALVVVVLVAAAARVVIPMLPLRGLSVRLGAVDLVLALAGLFGLAFHCGAMFYPSFVALSGLRGTVAEINALGTVSMVAFAGPSLILIFALRRVSPPALAAIALGLVAVGITMYNGGSLGAHLTAIFAAISLLVLCGAVFLVAPSSSRATTLR